MASARASHTLRATESGDRVIEAPEVERKLREAFADAERIEVQDLTGSQNRYKAVIVSAAFRGKSRVEQHRMVDAALGDLMHGPIHAPGARNPR